MSRRHRILARVTHLVGETVWVTGQAVVTASLVPVWMSIVVVLYWRMLTRPRDDEDYDPRTGQRR